MRDDLVSSNANDSEPAQRNTPSGLRRKLLRSLTRMGAETINSTHPIAFAYKLLRPHKRSAVWQFTYNPNYCCLHHHLLLLSYLYRFICFLSEHLTAADRITKSFSGTQNHFREHSF